MLIIALTAISLICLPLASSLELSFNYPKDVKINKEFTVSIEADSSEQYDVKVFVHKSKDDKIDRNEYISEIYNDGWKDSYLYIKGSFPEQSNYKIRVTSSPGQQEICARLRKTGSTSFSTQCERINVGEDEPEEEDAPKEAKKEIERAIIKEETDSSPKESTVQEFRQLSQNQERIVLGSKPLNAPTQNKVIITPEGTKKKFLIYGFTGFCVLVLVLLSLRKL